MELNDVAIVFIRLFLEYVAYYNYKMMYSYNNSLRVSPVLILYLTHSSGVIIFLKDLLKYKSNFFAKIKNDLQMNHKTFIKNTLYLSLFYNLCSIPKFYSMNRLSDASVVSIYGSSVLFTYLFSILMALKKVDIKGIFSLVIGTTGLILVIVRERNSREQIIWAILCFTSSIFSGLYTVLYKMSILGKKEVNSKKKRKVNIEYIKRKKIIDFFKIEDEFINSPKKNEKDILTINIDKLDLKNKSVNRDILYLRYYLAYTGLITLLFYWPFILFVKLSSFDRISLPVESKSIAHVILANIFSFLQNFFYFLVISSKSPVFAQVTGMIFQPSMLIIQMFQKDSSIQMLQATGYLFIFISFVLLGSGH